MVGAFATRLPFLIAAALIAAALADPVVESVANTGVLGGHFADDNHTGIIPTLLAGVVVVLELLVLHFIGMWRQAQNGSSESLLGVAREFATHSIARDLPLLFVMQIGALFMLESAEQLTTTGKLLGGTLWLGGPVIFSLLTHALFGIGCRYVLGAVMRAIVHAFAAIVRTMIRFVWLTIAGLAGGGIPFDRRAMPILRAQSPHVRQFGGRAPPLPQPAA